MSRRLLLRKDPKFPGLYLDVSRPRGSYYFRKFISGTGELKRSLQTTSRQEAIARIRRYFYDWIQEPKSDITIDRVILELYDVYRTKAERTQENLEWCCRVHLVPYFSGYAIADVARDWASYVAFQKQKSPLRRLGHDRKYLTLILNYAVSRGYLDRFSKLELDAGDRIADPIRVYEPGEVDRILNCGALSCVETRHTFFAKTVQKLQLQICLGLYCGMRPGEVRHLRWEWVDFNLGVISLPGEITKTRTGRTYPVSAEILRRLFARRGALRSGYVFPLRGNRNAPEGRTDKNWQRFKKALGICGKRYWFRHSHATAAIRSGVPETLVKKNMGTSLEMLERVYVRPSAEDFEKQAEAVSRFYSGGLG